MTAVSDKAQHYKTIHKTCLTANIVYMIVHAFYLVLFIIARLDILTFVDAAVIALYGLCFLPSMISIDTKVSRIADYGIRPIISDLR